MPNRDLAALVGSRICHDLVSPLGAIGNGVELLELSGADGKEELALISESVESATARLRFFRIAFGSSAGAALMGRAEVTRVLAEISAAGRMRYLWDMPEARPRNEVRCAFLAFMCLETAMPKGGDVRASVDGSDWRIEGEAETLRAHGALWDALTDPHAKPEISAAQVQFALLPRALADLGRTLRIDISSERAALYF